MLEIVAPILLAIFAAVSGTMVMAGKAEGKAVKAVKKISDSGVVRTAAKALEAVGGFEAAYREIARLNFGNTYDIVNELKSKFEKIDEKGGLSTLLKDTAYGSAIEQMMEAYAMGHAPSVKGSRGYQAIMEELMNDSKTPYKDIDVSGFRSHHSSVRRGLMKALGLTERDVLINYTDTPESHVAPVGSKLRLNINKYQHCVDAATDELHELFEGYLIQQGVSQKEAHKRAEIVLPLYAYNISPLKEYGAAYVKSFEKGLYNQALENPKLVREIKNEQGKLIDVSKYLLRPKRHAS